MTDDPTEDETIDDLSQLAGGLAMPELDAERAAHIMQAAHEDLARGHRPSRFLEPALVTLLSAGYFMWAFSYVLDAWAR